MRQELYARGLGKLADDMTLGTGCSGTDLCAELVDTSLSICGLPKSQQVFAAEIDPNKVEYLICDSVIVGVLRYGVVSYATYQLCDWLLVLHAYVTTTHLR